MWSPDRRAVLLGLLAVSGLAACGLSPVYGPGGGGGKLFGKVRPRDIVTRFEARLGSSLLFAWEPGIAIAQNPYIEFTFLARESGELALHWQDDEGRSWRASRAIAVQG